MLQRKKIFLFKLLPLKLLLKISLFNAIVIFSIQNVFFCNVLLEKNLILAYK